MYDDSEYLVLRINKGHRKGYPFDNFQEAFIKAIQVAEECAASSMKKSPWVNNDFCRQGFLLLRL